MEAREATDQELLSFHTRDLITEVERSRNLSRREQEELCRLVKKNSLDRKVLSGHLEIFLLSLSRFTMNELN